MQVQFLLTVLAASTSSSSSAGTAPGTAAAAMSVLLRFTPVPALLGGVTLGIAALGRMALTGRIMGISGLIKGFVGGDRSAARIACTSGLLVGGVLAGRLLPSAFDALPASFTVARAAAGGALVGFGASMANGCTSGHGICGLARLSVRSLVNSHRVLHGDGRRGCDTGPDRGRLGRGPCARDARLAGGPAAAGRRRPGGRCCSCSGRPGAGSQEAWVAAAVAWLQARSSALLEVVSEFQAGLAFAGGLVASGMVRPSKVAGFLSPTHPAWDPSLMFVMGGGLLVTLPGFAALRGTRGPRRPLVAGSSFAAPASAGVDWRLVLGGVLFGTGWGLSGMCPGPALVAAAGAWAPQTAAYVAGMVAGMWAEARLLAATGLAAGGGRGGAADRGKAA